MTRIERLLQERGANEPAQRKSAFRFRALRRLARRSSRGSRGARRRHAGVAAARHRRFRLRSDVHARWPHPHLRRDDLASRSTACRRSGSGCRTAPAPSSNWRRSALTSATLTLPASGEKRTPSAFTCTGRFACRNAPIAISTAMSGMPPVDEERFARAFAREIETTAARAPGREVSSIFLGGGTPSLMQPQTVGADPGCDRQALARRARCGSHAGSQSHQRRGDALCRLSRSRRQPSFARRAGAGRCLAEGAGTPAHRARGAGCGRDRAHALSIAIPSI